MPPTKFVTHICCKRWGKWKFHIFSPLCMMNMWNHQTWICVIAIDHKWWHWVFPMNIITHFGHFPHKAKSECISKQEKNTLSILLSKDRSKAAESLYFFLNLLRHNMKQYGSTFWSFQSLSFQFIRTRYLFTQQKIWMSLLNTCCLNGYVPYLLWDHLEG